MIFFKKKKALNTSICPLPWNHVSINPDGQSSPCCLIPFSEIFDVNVDSLFVDLKSTSIKKSLSAPSREKLRQDMIADKKPNACTVCYKQEERGGKSRRLRELEYWKNFEQKVEPNFLEIRFGNLCNLSCATCSVSYSSKWVDYGEKIQNVSQNSFLKLYLKSLAQQPIEPNWYKKDSTFFESLLESVKKVKLIQFGGGEPLIHPEHTILIQKMIADGSSKDIELRYNTNLTHLKNEHLEMWKKFKKVELCISLDGVFEKNDFIRYPTNFSDLEKKMELVDSTDDHIYCSILFTVNMLNFININEILEWKKERKFKKINVPTNLSDVFIHTLHYPKFLNIQNYPMKLKHQIAESHKKLILDKTDTSEFFKNQIKDHIEYMMIQPVDQPDQWSIFSDYVRSLATVQKKNFNDIFPELTEYL